MKNGKAAGPSGVVAEMLRAAPDICRKIIADLMNTIMREGRVPADWNDSIIVSLCDGKGDALDQNNYCELKLTFVNLEKTFNRVPRKVLWWALCVVCIPEWLVKVVQAMYVGARSRTRVNSSFSEEFEVKVGVHQGSV